MAYPRSTHTWALFISVTETGLGNIKWSIVKHFLNDWGSIIDPGLAINIIAVKKVITSWEYCKANQGWV